MFLKLHRGSQQKGSRPTQHPRLELLAQAETRRREDLMRGLEPLVKVSLPSAAFCCCCCCCFLLWFSEMYNPVGGRSCRGDTSTKKTRPLSRVSASVTVGVGGGRRSCWCKLFVFVPVLLFSSYVDCCSTIVGVVLMPAPPPFSCSSRCRFDYVVAVMPVLMVAIALLLIRNNQPRVRNTWNPRLKSSFSA